MEHKKAKNLLSDYIDGRLGDDSRRELEAHLDSCLSCRAELDALRKVGSALRRMPVEKMPDDAANRLRERLGLFPTEKRPLLSRLVFSPLLPIAAIALVLAISVTVISLSGRVQMRTAPQTEMKDSRGPAIVADIPESPTDKSANEYSPALPETGDAPEKGGIRSLTEENLSQAAEEPRLIFSDKNYTPEGLESLFGMDKAVDGDFERLKQTLVKDAGTEGEELSRVFDALKEKYPSAKFIYIERAKLQDKPAWIILVKTGGIKRIVVFS